VQKVLLVEDDPLVYRLYQKLFRLENYEIETAVNGQEGLEKMKVFTPDIILLDVMMKTMNGLEMLTKLKENKTTADIPVVVLTNVSDMRITQLASDHGAATVMVKSQSEPADVVGMVKGVLAKAAQ
jgi:DNA-binding response OmpR family regulator